MVKKIKMGILYNSYLLNRIQIKYVSVFEEQANITNVKAIFIM